jgi:hypothetical protein
MASYIHEGGITDIEDALALPAAQSPFLKGSGVIRWNDAALGEMIAVSQHAMLAFAEEFKDAAIEGSPAEYGNNRRSIDFELDSDKGSLFTTSGHGGYLEVGTGLYGPMHRRITSTTGKLLVWEGKDGKKHFARSTAGMKARPYIRPAFDKTKARLGSILKERGLAK